MKEQKEKKPRKKISGEKRFYLITALGATVALVAIIVVAVAVSGANKIDQNQAANNSSSIITGNNGNNLPPSGDGGNNDDEQVVVTPEGMLSPMETVNVINDYGFYHNTTLNSYYEHKGVDFAASAGTQVLAAQDGVVESIYKEDLLLGTEIVIDHGDGLKTVYRFVTETEDLKVGDKVKKGAVIACVAEANGNEYKDGAHLHFEVRKDGKTVDPAEYLTMEEK
jgi:murein DD-endopeptidase MepM/ murein hydrolase activator NlpD